MKYKEIVWSTLWIELNGNVSDYYCNCKRNTKHYLEISDSSFTVTEQTIILKLEIKDTSRDKLSAIDTTLI